MFILRLAALTNLEGSMMLEIGKKPWEIDVRDTKDAKRLGLRLLPSSKSDFYLEGPGIHLATDEVTKLQDFLRCELYDGGELIVKGIERGGAATSFSVSQVPEHEINAEFYHVEIEHDDAPSETVIRMSFTKYTVTCSCEDLWDMLSFGLKANDWLSRKT